MGVRESINENQRMGIGVAAAILIVAFGLIGYQVFGRGGSGVKAPKYAFYTDDNGKTFFKDDVYKVVPFDRNGKQAYRADVYQCADGKQFVAWMYRHNALGRKAMQEHLEKGGDDPRGTFLAGLELQGMEVKAAGAPDTAWKPNPGATALTAKCPSGGTAEPVTP